MFLLTLQGKPTGEEPFSHNATTEPGDIDGREDETGIPTILETVSIFLTVLSPNDTVTTEEDGIILSSQYNTTNSTNSSSIYNILHSYSTTKEPEYYDDHNLTTFSSTLNELEADGDAAATDDLDMLSSSVHLGSSTESSSLLSSLITDEMEVADSLDESVTATMLMLKDENGGSNADDDDGTGHDDDNDADFRTADGDISSQDAVTRSGGNTALLSSSTDDSIIIASMSSILSVDTVEPLSRYVISTDGPPKNEIPSSPVSSSRSSSSSAPDPTLDSFPETHIHE